MDKTYVAGYFGALSALTLDDWIAVGGLIVGAGMLILNILKYIREGRRR